MYYPSNSVVIFVFKFKNYLGLRQNYSPENDKYHKYMSKIMLIIY